MEWIGFSLAFILIFIAYKILKKLLFKNKRKQKNEFDIINEDSCSIFDYSSELKEELNILTKQKTLIFFHLFKRNKRQENFQYLECDWLNKKISIEYGENNKIEVPYDKSENSINSEYFHKIKLISNKSNIDFFIHILLHQKNYFNLYIDDTGKKAFSLEEVFYSKIESKFQRIKLKSEDIMNHKLAVEDYKSQNFMRCNYINIGKEDLEEIMSQNGQKLPEKIFEKGNRNLFLNILLGEEKKAKAHLFLNDIYFKLEIKKEDYELLETFYNKFILSKLYLSLEEKDEEDYLKELYDYLEEAYIKLNGDKDDIIFDDNINKDKDLNSNNIVDIIEDEFTKKLKKYIYFIHRKILIYLSFLISIKNNINEEHIILCEKICLLFLSTSEYPYLTIPSFFSFKKRFFENKDLSCYDKLKILISLKTFLYLKDPSLLQLVEYSKLPKNSPFIQGYLFYKSIIENLKLNSFLTFIYNQINSGSGYDYISQENCYKLKFIPLCIIKSHLLLNNFDNKYFFIYSMNDGNNAFTEGYSKDTFFNLYSLHYKESIINMSQDLENDSTKIGLLYLHENPHIKFRISNSFDMKSPRGIIKPDLQMFWNDYVVNEYNNEEISLSYKSGESGRAVEFFLFNDNEAINKLIKYKKIKELKNVNLYIQENNENLVQIMNRILKKKKFQYHAFNFIECQNLKYARPIKEIKRDKNIYDTMILP